MLNYFYDKTCTTERIAFSSVDGWTKATHTIVYTAIPCAFRAVKKQNLQGEPQAQEVDRASYTASLQWEYVDVRMWDYLLLSDKSGISLWKFLIVDVIQYPNLKWQIDNIALTIKKYDG